MQCKAMTQTNKRCQAKAIKNSDYCFIHDPASGAERAKARKKGGERNRTPHAGDASIVKGKPRSIDEAMTILDYTLAEIVPLENSIARGRLLIALCAGFVDALKVGEIEARLAAIESALKSRG